jgi:hypothetical protein
MGNAVELDVRAGMEPREFVEKWTDRVYPDRRRLYEILAHLAQDRLAPFDAVPEHVRERYAGGASNLRPARIVPAEGLIEWHVDGYWPVLLVAGGCALHFDLPEGATQLSGRFGMLDPAVERGRAPGVRAVVSGGPTELGERQVLWERAIDPVRVKEHRGPQEFKVNVPPGVRHVVLEMIVPEEAEREARWAYWGDLFFE